MGQMNTSKNVLRLRRLSDKLKSREDSKVENTLVIGIDFGTTFSGAAWATIEDFEADQINMILSWLGYGREEGKAPTAIYYDRENDEVKWGYDIPEEVTPLQWFKLLLLRSGDLPEKVQQSDALLSAKRMLRQSGKSAVDVVADYLRLLWKHIISTIHKDRGEPIVDRYELHVVLTVPAIWHSYARQSMREAAKKAGIMDNRPSGPTTLSFAPEPEAAAMATMYEFDELLEDGDVYIICDAGGGTVDLTNYQITGTEPLELREVGIGTGDLCGGIFIDEAFRRMCKGRLGRQWNKLSGKGIKEIMKKEWELVIKPQFMPQKTKSGYTVSIPAEAVGRSDLNDPSKGIKNGRIHFSDLDIQEAFAEVFSDIKELIDAQIENAQKEGFSIKGIILVGGLGSSAYLYDQLSSKYRSRRITILQSEGFKPRTAICRGAILEGFIDGPRSKDEEAQKAENELKHIKIQFAALRKEFNKVMVQGQSHVIHHITDSELSEKVETLRYNILNVTVQCFEADPVLFQAPSVLSLMKHFQLKIRNALSSLEHFGLNLDAFTKLMQSCSYRRVSVVQALIWATLCKTLFGKFAWTGDKVAGAVMDTKQFLYPDDDTMFEEERSRTLRRWHTWRATTSIVILDALAATAGADQRKQEEICEKIVKPLESFLKPFVDALEHDAFATGLREIVREAIDLDKVMNKQVPALTWVHKLEQLPDKYCSDEMDFDPESQSELPKKDDWLIVTPGLKKLGNSTGKDFNQVTILFKTTVVDKSIAVANSSEDRLAMG